MTGALAGVTVIDFTERVQGPHATQILGDLGADVVKIERVEALTPDGRPDERYGVSSENGTLYRATFLANNRNKRSLAVNIKDPDGRALVLDLIARADMVYENFRPGVMDRLGLGFDACREVNPRIIYVSATGYGDDGPYQTYPGQDLLAQAVSGMGQMNCAPDGRPLPVGMSITDVLGGMYGAVGALAALVHQRNTGEGQRVSVDLVSAALAAQAEHLVHFMNSDVGEPRRVTPQHAHGYIPPPYGFYRTKDGYLALSSGRQITQLCEILDIPDLSLDPRFDTFDKRLANRAEFETILERALATRSTEQWLEVMIPRGIFAQRVNTFAEALADPQIQHRHLAQRVRHSRGEVRLVGSPVSLSRTPTDVRLAPPDHGEHTRSILASLNVDDTTIEGLFRRKVVA
jgi:crotonobetainyl-CoA:carnitine CoA-transferase CaiB-like acyl-CoA transferase